MMTVECYRCGREYIPSRDQIIAGVWRKACPTCHPPMTPLKPAAKEQPSDEA